MSIVYPSKTVELGEFVSGRSKGYITYITYMIQLISNNWHVKLVFEN